MNTMPRPKQFKKKAQGRCDCSRWAVAIKRGEPMCQHCIDLMNREIEARKRKTAGVKDAPVKYFSDGDYLQQKWDRELGGFEKENPVGWGPFEQLEQQLNRIAA